MGVKKIIKKMKYYIFGQEFFKIARKKNLGDGSLIL